MWQVAQVGIHMSRVVSCFGGRSMFISVACRLNITPCFDSS